MEMLVTTPARPNDKTTWVLGLLGLLMVGHLGFLGFRPADDTADRFQRAAETYITVILALMAPIPGRK